MQVIVPQHKITFSALGEQSFQSDTKYRRIKYLLTLSVPDGMLIYNALTAELLLLDGEEISVFNAPDKADEGQLLPLVKKWVLVPEAHDDLKLSRQFADIMFLLNRSRVGMPQNRFTILPTTDCNARCFYCYELACNRRNMSERTARDVADYIIRKCDKSRKVSIRWFGGEPLYNSEAIDIICDGLAAAGIDYGGNMISNGYLFGEDTVARAKEKWHISWVQITLDGTEEIYNRTKAYIYKNSGSAFSRVLDNIGHLLDAGIAVHARMNMDDHNEDDLFKLTDMLIERFGKYSHFYLYANLLFEEDGSHAASHSVEIRHALTEKHMKLRRYISDSGHGIRNVMTVNDRSTHCMADRDDSALILPDGNLGKCEHFTDDNYYGSIYSDDIDLDVINRFKDTDVVVPGKCDKCELRPQCVVLKSCLILPRRCDEVDKKFMVFDLETKMRLAYEYFKKENKL